LRGNLLIGYDAGSPTIYSVYCFGTYSRQSPRIVIGEQKANIAVSLDGTCQNFVLYIGLVPVCFAHPFSAPCHQLQEIKEDQGVDHEQANTDEGESAIDLEYLPRQKGGRDGQCEVLSPRLFKIETGSLNQIEGTIEKYHRANTPKQLIIKQRSFVENEVNEARLGIEAQVISQPGEFVANVLVEQTQSAHADG